MIELEILHILLRGIRINTRAKKGQIKFKHSYKSVLKTYKTDLKTTMLRLIPLI